MSAVPRPERGMMSCRAWLRAISAWAKLCRDCGKPTDRPYPALYCAEDAQERKRLAHRRSQEKWNRSPVGKISKASWVECNRERNRANRHRYYYKVHPGYERQCKTLLCPNKVIRTPQHRSQAFCDECAKQFFGKKYVQRRARGQLSRAA